MALQAGQLYVLAPSPEELDVEWLILRVDHPEQGVSFAVPTDSFPLIGPADIDLQTFADRPLVARCGHGTFLDSSHLVHLTQTLQPAAPALARHVIGELARGKYSADSDRITTAADPEYEEHLELVERAMVLVQRL